MHAFDKDHSSGRTRAGCRRIAVARRSPVCNLSPLIFPGQQQEVSAREAPHCLGRRTVIGASSLRSVDAESESDSLWLLMQVLDVMVRRACSVYLCRLARSASRRRSFCSGQADSASEREHEGWDRKTIQVSLCCALRIVPSPCVRSRRTRASPPTACPCLRPRRLWRHGAEPWSVRQIAYSCTASAAV